MLTATALSNLYTMTVASKVDPRQKIPSAYTMPTEEERLLRARLMLEEVLETIRDLGLLLQSKTPGYLAHADDFYYTPGRLVPNLEGIIDGCCDEIYVATGTLCKVGAHDSIHLAEVCRANNAKFPNGIAVVDANGKYMKPTGWTPPNHNQYINGPAIENLSEVGRQLVEKTQC